MKNTIVIQCKSYLITKLVLKYVTKRNIYVFGKIKHLRITNKFDYIKTQINDHCTLSKNTGAVKNLFLF